MEGITERLETLLSQRPDLMEQFRQLVSEGQLTPDSPETMRIVTALGRFDAATTQFLNLGGTQRAINNAIREGVPAETLVNQLSAMASNMGMPPGSLDTHLNNAVELIYRLGGVSPVERIVAQGSIAGMERIFDSLSRGLTPASIVKPYVDKILEGLRYAQGHTPQILAGGVIALGIYNGLSGIYNWYNSVDKETISPGDIAAFEAAKLLRRQIQEAEKIEKDLEQAVILSNVLKNAPINLRNQILQNKYEDYALSVIARQLEQVINDTLPLNEFTTAAMLRRSTMPYTGRVGELRQGYPTSVIGISNI
jgi:hypothetical protein